MSSSPYKQIAAVCAAVIAVASASLARAGDPARPVEGAARSAQAEAEIELGKRLFFDPRLSGNRTVSCHSCHRLVREQGRPPSGTDNLRVSEGVFGRMGTRNAPTVWNAGKRSVLFWDGRVASLEEQAKGPFVNPLEMNMPNGEAVVDTVEAISAYREALREVYGRERGARTRTSIDEIASAIAAYERTLTTPNAPFDRFRAGEASALSERAKHGWDKFRSFACVACHGAPTFSGSDYFIRFPVYSRTEYETRYELTADVGRFGATGAPVDRNRWRVPSLRNVALTAPYFHNGKVETLDQAVRVMGRVQLNRVLTDEDVRDLVAFLESLTGEAPDEVPPVLPPDPRRDNELARPDDAQ